MMYVTKELASLHLRRDTSDDDLDLVAKINAASAAVKGHIGLNPPWQPELDSSDNPVLDSSGNIVYVTASNGDYVVNELIVQAVLYLLGCMYDDRGGQAVTDWSDRKLPQPVQSLLTGLHKPVLA